MISAFYSDPGAISGMYLWLIFGGLWVYNPTPISPAPARLAQAVVHPRVDERDRDPPHASDSAYYSQDLVFFLHPGGGARLYTALNMTSRVSQNQPGRRLLLAGAFAMGFGIWSMHFIGMLAFNPPIALGYDLTLTGLSGGSHRLVGLCVWLVSRPGFLASGLFRGPADGAGIATMHSTSAWPP